MTPKERAAMQQALEALREYRDTQMIFAPRKAIEALRESLEVMKSNISDHKLEQPVSQEPIGKVSSWNPIKGEITVTQYHSLNGYKEPAIGSEIYTAPQPVSQEPVFYNPPPTCANHIEGVPVGTRITAPQPVKEVELTDDEIGELWRTNTGGWYTGFARAVIAKHKEKQRG